MKAGQKGELSMEKANEAVRRGDRLHQKDMALLVGGLLIVLVCIGIVGYLLYSSSTNSKPMPEYALTFFTSITTLILGYLFGKEGGK